VTWRNWLVVVLGMARLPSQAASRRSPAACTRGNGSCHASCGSQASAPPYRPHGAFSLQAGSLSRLMRSSRAVAKIRPAGALGVRTTPRLARWLQKRRSGLSGTLMREPRQGRGSQAKRLGGRESSWHSQPRQWPQRHC